VKTLTCKGCGGTVLPSYFSEPKPDDGETKQRMVYYECPLCGPGCQNGPEDANLPRAFPAPVVAGAS